VRDDELAALRELLDDLVPSLAAKLANSGLGELEVRDGSRRVRLRREPDGAAPEARRDGGRTRTGRSGAGSATAGLRRDGAGSSAAAGGPRRDAAGTSGLTAVGPGIQRDGNRSGAEGKPVRSPAVGYYMPRDGVVPGQRVRSGDTVGHVDVLGVRQEVVAPADGVLMRVLAEPGEAVEYGQELARVAPVQRSAETDALRVVEP
jgi:biotin carboxyl carrier protein